MTPFSALRRSDCFEVVAAALDCRICRCLRLHLLPGSEFSLGLSRTLIFGIAENALGSNGIKNIYSCCRHAQSNNTGILSNATVDGQIAYYQYWANENVKR